MDIQKLIGKEYNYLTILKELYTTYKKVARCNITEKIVLCRCKCGKEVEKNAKHVVYGDIKSCGCIKKIYKSRLTHGGSRSVEYDAWWNMKERCNNPLNIGYKNYGARGIIVCNEWINSFETFIKDMGNKPSPVHSIDRINVNKNYEPGNCRWATNKEQMRNRTDTRYIEYNGEKLCVAEWAEKLNINYDTLHSRIQRGRLSIEDCLSPKLIKKGRKSDTRE